MTDEDPLIRQLILQFILILINAVFACAEIAVISINETKLERLSASGDKRAKRLLALTKQPARFLATIQVGLTLAGFLASAFAASNLSGRLMRLMSGAGVPFSEKTLNTLSLVIVTFVLSFITIVLGELVPKRIAMKNAERLSLAMSGLVTLIARVFAPLVWLLTESTNSLLRLMRIDPHSDDDAITEEEIRMMVDAGSETGAIDAEEKVIIHNVFEFDNKSAAEVMTHRTEIILLWMEESDEEWAATIIEHRFTHYPICGEDPDDIVGVLNSKDYFRLADKSRAGVLANAVRLAQFVPESVRTDVLFRNMKKSRNHFAVVLDEYGGMSGVVTVNDLLEELVGDLDDDQTAPPERPEIEKLDEHTWRVEGTAPLDEVATALGISLPANEYDTFSAMVFGLLGTVPEDGQQPELMEFGLAVKITDIREHRLESAIVTLAVPQEG